MQKIGVFLAKLILGAILVLAIWLFALSSSFSSQIEVDDISEVISDASAEIIAQKILEENNVTEDELDDLYKKLIQKCETRSSVDIPNTNITLSCEEVKNKTAEELKDVIISEVSEIIEDQVTDEIVPEDIDRYASYLINVRYVALVGALILVAIFFFLSSPKYNVLMNVGVIFMVAGLPYFLLVNFNPQELPIRLPNILQDFLLRIANHLSITIVLGLAMLAGWFLFVLVDKRKKKSVSLNTKKPNKKNDS